MNWHHDHSMKNLRLSETDSTDAVVPLEDNPEIRGKLEFYQDRAWYGPVQNERTDLPVTDGVLQTSRICHVCTS